MSEEIIIDGVDVAGCYYMYDNEDLNYMCQNGVGTCICRENKDCYYKQLKRLEFELEVTKADYEASEQENKELKAKIFELKECLKCFQTPEAIKALTFYKTGEFDLQEKRCIKLEQENKELKIYIESNKQQVEEAEMLVMDNDRLQQEVENLKNIIYYDVEKYRSAFKEIKRMVKGHKIADEARLQVIKGLINKVLESEEK